MVPPIDVLGDNMHNHGEHAAQKGDHGERKLRDWFQTHRLGFVHVNQRPAFFATLFRDAVKRPDFLVLLDSVGMLAVDAKNKEVWNGKEYTLTLDKELKRVIAFERMFRIPVWYAYCAQDGACWYWISALKALEVGIERQGGSGRFLEIDLRHFALLETGADIGKLYTHRVLSPARAMRRDPEVRRIAQRPK